MYMCVWCVCGCVVGGCGVCVLCVCGVCGGCVCGWCGVCGVCVYIQTCSCFLVFGLVLC